MPTKKKHIEYHIKAEGLSQKLSLQPLVDRLSEVINNAGYGTKILITEFLALIEKSIQQNKSLHTNLDDFQKAFEILENLSGVQNLSTSEYIAIATPIPDTIIHASADLYQLIGEDFSFYDEYNADNSCSTVNNKILYYLILERFYNIQNLQLPVSFISDKNGVERYYDLQIDFSNVSITCNGELPKIDFKLVKDLNFDSLDEIDLLLQLIDLQQFTFEGITILRFTNKDREFVSKKIQYLINNIATENKEFFMDEIQRIFKSIVLKGDINYNFLPLFELGGFPIWELDISKHNEIFLGKYIQAAKDTINCKVFNYLCNPSIFSYGLDKELDIQEPLFLKLLEENNIKYYLGLPLYRNGQFIGYIELYSHESKIEHNDILRIKPYQPLFAQLSSDIIIYLKNQLNKIILENYTSIQPSIQWKFNEVAISYLSQLKFTPSEAKLDKILFENVYPIYGAVDVKDSTKIRNASQKQVIVQHIEFLFSLYESFVHSIATNHSKAMQQLLEQISTLIKEKSFDKNLSSLRSLLQNDMVELLQTIKSELSSNNSLIQEINNIEIQLLNLTNSGKEPFEISLGMVTKMIKGEIDVLNNRIQDLFPSYFESFRTDGIEYDAYIGQSITPTMNFDIDHLKTIRQYQILSMIEIIRKGRALHAELPIPLTTTQLIFVHPDQISISFRADERRFDVEGGYNIKYQVIKKRIDKALIHNSKERLVQPDTIAIVYSNEMVEADIIESLDEINKLGLIEKEYSFLKLEELQGISELRAIRVKVR